MNMVEEWKANPTPVITVYPDGSLQCLFINNTMGDDDTDNI